MLMTSAFFYHKLFSLGGNNLELILLSKLKILLQQSGMLIVILFNKTMETSKQVSILMMQNIFYEERQGKQEYKVSKIS